MVRAKYRLKQEYPPRTSVSRMTNPSMKTILGKVKKRCCREKEKLKSGRVESHVHIHVHVVLYLHSRVVCPALTPPQRYLRDSQLFPNLYYIS